MGQEDSQEDGPLNKGIQEPGNLSVLKLTHPWNAIAGMWPPGLYTSGSSPQNAGVAVAPAAHKIC